MLECAFCHTSFSRRSWHSGTPHEKVVWQCITSTKKGEKYCPHSKGLDEKIDRANYEQKYAELDASLAGLLEEKARLEQSAQVEIDTGKRLEHFRKVLRTNKLLQSFDRNVFESIVEKIIIGADGDLENPDPYRLAFGYKTGFQNSIQSKIRRQSLKNPLKN